MEFIENAEDQDLAVDIARKAIELVEFLPDTDDLKVATYILIYFISIIYF